MIHEKQAALTQQDRATVITQNIDNLYEKAGTKHLIDFHGNLYNVYCEKCHERVPVADYLKSRIHEKDGGNLRPDIVLYDEGISQEAISRSLNAMSQADLVVIVGTSMKVYPFAGLLQYANPAAQVLAINQQALSLPVDFKMIQEDATKYFADLTV